MKIYSTCDNETFLFEKLISFLNNPNKEYFSYLFSTKNQTII